MREVVLTVVVRSFLVAASPGAETTGRLDDYREFKDQQGRSIQARVVEVTEEAVTIQRQDGRRFVVGISAFSQADQDYLRGLTKPSKPGTTSDDWPCFRRPDGSGTSAAKGLPWEWSAAKNVAWKTALPGPGASSPITFGDRIYLTCYTGYGLDQKQPGDKANLVRHLICLDRSNGRILWNTGTPSRHAVSSYENFIALHGFASGSPACDGRRVYCFFGSSGAYAFDLDGREQWHADVGEKTHSYGTGTSVVLHDNLVIVNASIEGGSLVALDKNSGREVWRAEGIEQAWNTPVFVDAGCRRELVLDTKDSLRGFDPTTGRELWRCAGSDPPRYLCPSPIVHDGIVYAAHGYFGPLSAVRPGGSGDVTDSHRLWVRPKVGSNVPSPVFHDGHIFSVDSDKGIFSCVDAASGELIFREHIQPSPDRIYASPLVADGKIYFVSREQGTYVLAASPKFELLAHNVIEDDDSIFNGSLAVSRGQLLLRSDKFLYCIGVK
jgi:outer membrane protein assembly factor BamB